MATKKTTNKSGSGNTTAETLQDLFLSSMKSIYWAENALVEALPQMYEAATDQKLKTAIKDHLLQTRQQVNRLEQAFDLLDIAAEGRKCLAIEGIIKEGQALLTETAEGPVRDAGIIASSQKIEHYEIAAYGTLAAFAKTLNLKPVLDLLLRTLGEEKKSDCLLSTIADTNLNSQAAAGGHLSKEKDITAV